METEQTRDEFVRILSDSDLTLNPVGFNTECYRIYEAMALGSMPVIEDVMTEGNCENHSSLNKSSLFQHDALNSTYNFDPPLRLLKQFGAPVIYVKNWVQDLNQLLEKESILTENEKIIRRNRIVQWYDDFKLKLKHRLVKVLVNKFFNANHAVKS